MEVIKRLRVILNNFAIIISKLWKHFYFVKFSGITERPSYTYIIKFPWMVGRIGTIFVPFHAHEHFVFRKVDSLIISIFWEESTYILWMGVSINALMITQIPIFLSQTKNPTIIGRWPAPTYYIHERNWIFVYDILPWWISFSNCVHNSQRWTVTENGLSVFFNKYFYQSLPQYVFTKYKSLLSKGHPKLMLVFGCYTNWFFFPINHLLERPILTIC